MPSVWTFGAALLVLSVISHITGGRAMLRTSLALLFNWMAQMVHDHYFHEPTPWAFFMLIDIVTASIILVRPSGRMQAVIGSTFVLQIAMHAAYGLTLIKGENPYAAYSYWQWLTAVACAQILLVAGWFGDGLARRIFGRGYIRRLLGIRDVAKAPHRPGMARP